MPSCWSREQRGDGLYEATHQFDVIQVQLVADQLGTQTQTTRHRRLRRGHRNPVRRRTVNDDVHRLRPPAAHAPTLAARDVPRLESPADLVYLLPWLDARRCRDAIVAARSLPL